MSIEKFKRALLHDSPPVGWSRPLQALWYQGKGDWQRAHALAQDVDSADGFWVHAHLHRIEGERVNAGYWYRCAGRTPPAVPIAQEFDEIAATLLQRCSSAEPGGGWTKREDAGLPPAAVHQRV